MVRIVVYTGLAIDVLLRCRFLCSTTFPMLSYAGSILHDGGSHEGLLMFTDHRAHTTVVLGALAGFLDDSLGSPRGQASLVFPRGFLGVCLRNNVSPGRISSTMRPPPYAAMCQVNPGSHFNAPEHGTTLPWLQCGSLRILCAHIVFVLPCRLSTSLLRLIVRGPDRYGREHER